MASKPKRIQRKRTRGWRMPEDCVYVGRPTKWGNPFRVGCYAKIGGPVGGKGPLAAAQWLYCIAAKPSPGFEIIQTRLQAVEWFRRLATVTRWRTEEIESLRGKNLACWCPLDRPCHADVLLEIANG